MFTRIRRIALLLATSSGIIAAATLTCPRRWAVITASPRSAANPSITAASNAPQLAIQPHRQD